MNPHPSEHNEQVAVVAWARTVTGIYPEMRLLFAIPNGAWLAGNARQRALQAHKLKSEGLQAGVPDLCLPVARNGYNGLFLEMKRRGGKLRPEQQAWLDALAEQGYLAVVCWSAEDAIETIGEYIAAKNLPG